MSNEPVQDVLTEAEALGIPWQIILSKEIAAEKALRDSVENLEGDWPLSCLFSLLPYSLLQSWRARERIHTLSWEARSERSRAAANRLRSVFLHLAGKRCPGEPFDFLLANHLGFAYERILQLQRIGRTAEKAKGSREDKIAEVVRRTHCSESDAAWGVDRSGSRRRGHRLDDAMRRAREEGFELPVAQSELVAFTRLKRFVQRRPFLRARRKLARVATQFPAPGDGPLAPSPWKPTPSMPPVFPESETAPRKRQGAK
jgi:hypothetical protein